MFVNMAETAEECPTSSENEVNCQSFPFTATYYYRFMFMD